MRRGRPAARLALAAALVASACATSAPPPVDFSEGPREFGPRDYDTVLERWSRHVKVWNYIDGTVIDIEQATSLPSDLLTLRRLSLAAMQASDAQSWDRLVDLVCRPSAQSATAS